MDQLKKYALFLHPVLLFGVALGLLFCYRAYEAEREGRIRLDETIKAQKVILDQQAQIIKDSAQSIKDRDAALTGTLNSLQKVQATAPASPVETAAQIARYLSLAQAPVVASKDSAPVAPGSVVFTPPEAEGLRQAAVGCSEAQAELSACRADARDRVNQTSALEAQVKTLTGERDQAVKAVHGGTFFTRLKRDAKAGGVGVLVGVVAAEVVAHAHH